MAWLNHGERIKETTGTTGTGTYTMSGAQPGFQSFDVIGDGNQCIYTVTDGVDWETGVGTYNLSLSQITRDTIIDSSNAGAAVNWGVGNKTIFNGGAGEYARRHYEQTYAGRKEVLTTTYTFLREDAGQIIEFNNVAAITATIPLDAATNFPVGTRFDVVMTGAGPVTIAHAGTLNGFVTVPGQHKAVTVYKQAADTWRVIGGI